LGAGTLRHTLNAAWRFPSVARNPNGWTRARGPALRRCSD
jgi:hypothetical protein